jgi:hypothetical protein
MSRYLFLVGSILAAILFLTALLTCRVSGGPF